MAAAAVVAWATIVPAVAQEREFTYRTVAGDTLIGIGKRFLLDPAGWPALQARNGVRNPHAMLVGTPIRIPVSKMRAEPRPIEVATVRGKVEGARGPLVAGTTIAEGDRIATAGDGFVTLRLADGSRVSVPAGSRVEIERSRTYGSGSASVAETVLGLLAGRVEAAAKPQGTGDRLDVRSRRALTGVRGTSFRVAALERDAVATEVIEGRVGVSEESHPRGVEVAGGFGTRVVPGEAPLPPVKLLPAPDATRTPALVERTLVRLPFGAVPGASAYRAQVAQDARFDTIVAEGKFPGPEAKFADLPDGDYFVRARAVDGNGLEGLDVSRPFRLKARPEPPFVAGPPDQAKLAADAAIATWSQSTEAATYRVQVSARADFATLAVDERGLAATRLEAGTRLKPGTWHWRVASVRADGDTGPWGDARRFTVVPDPPTPAGSRTADGRLAFDWGGEPGQRYRFQLAADKAFADVRLDRALDEPRVAFEEPGAGEYFFRIRAVDADGFQGNWSAAQRIEVEPSRWWPLLLLLLPLL